MISDDSFIEWHLKQQVAAFAYSSQARGYLRRLDTGSIAQAPENVRALFGGENE
jgi:hypothetical protein